jgi:hypothetical protein
VRLSPADDRDNRDHCGQHDLDQQHRDQQHRDQQHRDQQHLEHEHFGNDGVDGRRDLCRVSVGDDAVWSDHELPLPEGVDDGQRALLLRPGLHD